MNFLRYHLARFMWWLQDYGRCDRNHNWLYFLCRWPYHGGRHYDWQPVTCEECGWRGPRRWCWHTYSSCGDDEVEPCDECPGCGQEI